MSSEDKKGPSIDSASRLLDMFFHSLTPFVEKDEELREELKSVLKNVETVEELDSFLEEHPALVTDAFKLHAPKLDVAWLRIIAKHTDLLLLLDEKISLMYRLPAVAAMEGHLDVVRYLLDEVPGFEIDKNYGGISQSMIHIACGRGKIDVVKELLQRGSNPSLNFIGHDYVGHGTTTPAFHAVCGGYIDIIDLLYLAGGSFEGCLPLQISENDTDTILHLLNLDVLHGKDLLRIVSGEKTFFLKIYTLLSSSKENGKKRAHRFLDETLSVLQTYIVDEDAYDGKKKLRKIVLHFSTYCVATKDHEERETLMEILRPHIDTEENGYFSGVRI